ncbi:MAG: hypothetical protein IJP90_19270, partial [Treponema sp.]|nr:hypothetical protein [Treponema sp.]
MVQILQKLAFDTSICYRMSLIVFLVSILFATVFAIKKLDIVKPLRIFGIGLAFCDFIILIPTLHNVGDCGEFLSSSVSSAIMNMVQLVTLNVGYDSLVKSASDSNVLLFFTILCVLTPVVWGGVVLTLFENFSSYLAYHVFSFFVPVYIFSELN